MLFIGVAFGFFGEMLNVDPHISGAKITIIAFAMAAALALIAIWMNPPMLGRFQRPGHGAHRSHSDEFCSSAALKRRTRCDRGEACCKP